MTCFYPSILRAWTCIKVLLRAKGSMFSYCRSSPTSPQKWQCNTTGKHDTHVLTNRKTVMTYSQEALAIVRHNERSTLYIKGMQVQTLEGGC